MLAYLYALRRDMDNYVMPRTVTRKICSIAAACSITVLLLRLTGKRVCTTQLPSGRLATAAALTVSLEIGGGKWETKGMNESAN